jgi:hypothetical protein
LGSTDVRIQRGNLAGSKNRCPLLLIGGGRRRKHAE